MTCESAEITEIKPMPDGGVDIFFRHPCRKKATHFIVGWGLETGYCLEHCGGHCDNLEEHE